MMSSKGIHIENEQIEAVKLWPEPQLVRDIQVYLRFANFYRRFIQRFYWLATPLISMLKFSGTKSAKPRTGGVVVDGDSTARRGGSEIDESRSNKVQINGGEVEVDKVEKKVQKTSKSKNLSKTKITIGSLNFFTLGAKLAFTKFRQVFLKALILHYFDPELHICIKTDISGYAIGRVSSQLISDNLGQWHPVAFFFCKMISVETRYKTHSSKLLAIVEVFKTWKHYLEGSRHEVLVRTNHNILQQFIDTKSLSLRQVCSNQKLFCYYFQIDYC